MSQQEKKRKLDESLALHQREYVKLFKKRSELYYDVIATKMKGTCQAERQTRTKLQFSDILNPLEVQRSVSMLISSLFIDKQIHPIELWSFRYANCKKEWKTPTVIMNYKLSPSSADIDWDSQELLFFVSQQVKPSRAKVESKTLKKQNRAAEHAEKHASLARAEAEIYDHLSNRPVLLAQIKQNDRIRGILKVKRGLQGLNMDQIVNLALNEFANLATKRAQPPKQPPIVVSTRDAEMKSFQTEIANLKQQLQHHSASTDTKSGSLIGSSCIDVIKPSHTFPNLPTPSHITNVHLIAWKVLFNAKLII
eukprot:1126552_1